MGMKNVTVKTKMGAGMKVDCFAGNHTLFIDQPAAAGGTDSGPTPLEYYALSIAGCISSIARIMARQKSINMRGIEVTVSGDLDADVLLGKSRNARAGFQGFTVTVDMDADLTPEQKKEFLEEVEGRCPVSENTSNPTPVQLVVAV